ncbi:hypothetical protein WMF18_31945 [Sorangium sp. So ce315]
MSPQKSCVPNPATAAARSRGTARARGTARETGRCKRRAHPAAGDEDDARAKRLDVVHVVRRQDHRDPALAVEPLDEAPHRELRDGVEADRGLVEEEQVGRVERRRTCAMRSRGGAPRARPALGHPVRLAEVLDDDQRHAQSRM